MRVKDENKRQAIRDATVLEVVKGGLSSASIAKIANRAGLSQGTIYLYFPSKERLLQDVYLEIKRDIHARMMSANDASVGSAEHIKSLWFLLLEYAVEHPNDFAFSELLSAAQLLEDAQISELEVMSTDIRVSIDMAVADGTLIDAPVQSIMSVLTSPAIQAARSVALQGKPLDKAKIERTFDLIWRGIAK